MTRTVSDPESSACGSEGRGKWCRCRVTRSTRVVLGLCICRHLLSSYFLFAAHRQEHGVTGLHRWVAGRRVTVWGYTAKGVTGLSPWPRSALAGGVTPVSRAEAGIGTGCTD